MSVLALVRIGGWTEAWLTFMLSSFEACASRSATDLQPYYQAKSQASTILVLLCEEWGEEGQRTCALTYLHHTARAFPATQLQLHTCPPACRHVSPTPSCTSRGMVSRATTY